MASTYPQNIDSFSNPTYIKVNGVDLVRAEHVNDLQDAVVATQQVSAGAGKVIDYASNNFIADDTSFKVCIEALDAEAGAVRSDYTGHTGYVLPTDPFQHHANVIAVTAIGNLASSRVQLALEEHQTDIDAIMSGGFVEGTSLDDRYVGKLGAEILPGPLTITNSLSVNGEVNLGDNIADVVNIAGTLSVGSTSNFANQVTLQDNILMQTGKKIADTTDPNADYFMFTVDGTEVYSRKDITFRIDSDDPTDGLAEDAEFKIRNGADTLVFSVNEIGNISAIGDITGVDINGTTKLTAGAADSLEIFEDRINAESEKLHIQLDKNDGDPTARLVVTMDGDTGNDLASSDLLINIDQDSTLITGIHKLKSGIQENGYFGFQTYSNNAGGVFYGNGVNFKHVLTNSPSSITLTVDENINAQNISVTHLNNLGFSFMADSVAVGAIKVRGTYLTIGN